jgi:hypothetical protein
MSLPQGVFIMGDIIDELYPLGKTRSKATQNGE